jgi:hypothetical protein
MSNKYEGHFMRPRSLALYFIFACGIATGAVAQSGTIYDTKLLAAAFDSTNRASVAGEGNAQAVLADHKLTISGNFQGLSSPAIKAQLFRGVAVGVPGQPILSLTVSPATSGTLSGAFDLTDEQMAALSCAKLYVQIDTQQAPTGALWGWLMPHHAFAGQDVPVRGNWFLQPDCERGRV